MNRHEFFHIIPALPQRERERIQWAYSLAKNYHRIEKRDDGTRYFDHVRGTALILLEMGYTRSDTIVLGLLHDILEDTFLPISLVEHVFGPEITRALLTLSKVYRIEDPLTGNMIKTAKQENATYFAHIERAGEDVVLVKLADRTYNMRDLVHPAEGSRWTPEKCLSKCAETRQWVLPMAKKRSYVFERELLHLCNTVEANARLAQSTA